MLTGLKLGEAIPQQAGDTVQLVGGYFAKCPTGEFKFNGPHIEGAADHFFLRQETFLKELQFESPGGLELRLALAVPCDKGGLGNAKLGGDSGKAQALSAEFNELGFSFGRVHRLVDG